MTISYNQTGQWGTSQFIVGPVGKAPYSTVALALAAADAAGGGTVYIQPGSYTESITWPAGISVQAASTGLEVYEVIITGNQIFSDTGNLSIQGVKFISPSGDAWTYSSVGGSSQVFLEFLNCYITAAGNGITASATGTNVVLRINNCFIFSTGIGVNITGSALFSDVFSTVSTAGHNSSALSLNGTGQEVDVNSCTYQANGVGSNCIYINNTSSLLAVASTNCTYEAANAAFYFNAPDIVVSIQDIFFCNGTYFAQSSGAYGRLLYASDVIAQGTSLVDPQITTQDLLVVPSQGSLSWSSISANQAMVTNHGYIVESGALTLSLPVVSSVGDSIGVALDAGISWTLTQGAGQSIKIGSEQTTIGSTGSLASTSSSGDLVILLCTVANTSWISTTSQGNFALT